MTHPIVPCLADEKAAAVALGCSVSFLRKDRYGKKSIPTVRVGNRIKYDLDQIRAYLAASEGRNGARPTRHSGEPDPELTHIARFPPSQSGRFLEFRFRTPEEASWGLFFKALGLQWAYEPKEFDVPPMGHRHVPAFRVLSPQGYVFWYDVRPRSTPYAPVDPAAKAFSHWLLLGEDKASQAVFRQLNGDPMDVLLSPDEGQHSPWRVCPRCGGINCSRPAQVVLASGRLSAGWDTIRCDVCKSTVPEDDGSPIELGICRMQIQWFRGVMSLDVQKWLDFRRKVMAAAVEASQYRELRSTRP